MDVYVYSAWSGYLYLKAAWPVVNSIRSECGGYGGVFDGMPLAGFSSSPLGAA